MNGGFGISKWPEISISQIRCANERDQLCKNAREHEVGQAWSMLIINKTHIV